MGKFFKGILGVGLMTALSVVWASPVLGEGLAGVSMAESRKVGEQSLVLNGVGLRKKAIFKVYVAGLYLPSKQKDANKILSMDTPRALDIEFVRTVGRDSLTGAWDDCLSSNTPKAGQALKDSFKALGGWMEDMKSGDRIGFSYDPTKGLTVEVKGRAAGTVEGKAFADALFKCWIGEVPPSADFKAGLLGG